MLPQPHLDALPLGAHSLSALTDDALFAACGVRIAFTGRAGGVSTGPYASLNTYDEVDDDPACVARNRGLVLVALGAPDALLIVPNQVHGVRVVSVDAAGGVPHAAQQAREGVDGIVVDVAGVAVLLNFADCLPLVIVAPSGRFAIAHAGWRGALAGIAGKAARTLAAREGEGSVAGFNAYIGPHIRSECFETGAEIAAQFADEFGEGVLRDSRHVSLANAVVVDLLRAGMSGDRIADAGVCTMCHPDRYFSYRASGGTCGRQAAAAIMIKRGQE